MAGPGTGLDRQGVAHKATVIDQALARHGAEELTPLEALRIFGGLEIAALTGAYLGCAQAGIPILLDGFISSVAALVAGKIQAECNQQLILAHLSAEPGHMAVVEALGINPLLDLGMRLGEASGAAL